MTPNALSTQMRALIARIERTLGATFSLEDIIAFVQSERGKPLKIEEVPFPNGTTGCAFSLADVDMVFIHSRLEPWRYISIRIHEFLHLLLGHAPESPLTYEEFLDHPDPKLVLAVYRAELGDELADEPDDEEHAMTVVRRLLESEVEATARDIARRIAQYETSKGRKDLPPDLLMFFGERS